MNFGSDNSGTSLGIRACSYYVLEGPIGFKVKRFRINFRAGLSSMHTSGLALWVRGLGAVALRFEHTNMGLLCPLSI